MIAPRLRRRTLRSTLAALTARTAATALAAFASLALALACEPAAPPPHRPPDIVLIVIDTLRWDRLGVQGANPQVSPALDAFAARSVRFERAYATAPWTKPSVASMITGLHPSTHGGQTVDQPLPEEAITLAERLARHGYATHGIVSNFVLSRKNGFAQGFDAWDQGQARGFRHVSTGAVSDKAIAALESLTAGDAPFFLFVHYFDPHYDYVHHPDVGFARPQVGRIDGTLSIEALRRIAPRLDEAEIAQLRALYDEEVRHTDAGIGRVLARIDALGSADDTLIVVTSDHGEELLERGWLGHTRTLYDELIRVPLLVRAPGLAPAVVDRPVSLVGLTPTLLDLAGIAPDDARFQGASFAGALRGDTLADAAPPLLVEVDFSSPRARDKTAFKKSVVHGRHKLIRDDRSGALELYDLQRDPLELEDLADARPELVAALEPILDDLVRTAAEGRLDAPSTVLDPSEIELLRELGYIEDD